MNAPLHTLRLLADDELGALVARLKRQVEALDHAAGEIGLRIRANYQDALDAALVEAERRRNV